MKKFDAILVFTAIIIIAFLLAPLARGENGVTDDISSTQELIKNSYDAVKEAEAEGADISTLIVKLNDAAKLLSQAELAYSVGDYNLASSCLSQSNSRLTGLVSEASALKEEAIVKSNQDSVTTVLSIIGSISILALGSAIVIALKQKERKA